jgi:beta-lactam-binding protein with PASTA domain
MRTPISLSLAVKAMVLIVAVILGLISSLSYAGGVIRHIAIDFGFSVADPAASQNDSNGEAWVFNSTPCVAADFSATTPVGCLLDFTTASAATISSGPLSLGFSVNLAGTKYSAVHVNQNGILTFGAALTTYTAVTDLTSLQTVAGPNNPFIAGFYPGTTALVVPYQPDPSQISSTGGVEFGRALANPDGIDEGSSPDIVNDVAAFKATWFECTDSSDLAFCSGVAPANPAGVRIVLYDRSAGGADGDFDVRFEYGSQSGGSTEFNNGSGQYGVVGFSLGSVANTLNLSGSAASPTVVPGPNDIYYQFRNGVLVGAVTSVTVPDVTNETLTAATAAITGAGLIVGTTSTVSSPTVPSGEVISQSPAGNTSAPAGSAVNLVLSSGPTTVKVPNVVNVTLATATSILNGVGLVVGTTTSQASSTVPSGSVISQNPAAGANAVAGSAVSLIISSGPLQVTVPSVVNDTVATATTVLTSAGLKVGTVTKQTSSTVAAGSVISQSPLAGTSVASGSAVGLVVSSGALRGDVNHDGQVDILDLVAVLEALGKKVSPGDPRDLNGDGIVNLKDAQILIRLCTNVACLIRAPHH